MEPLTPSPSAGSQAGAAPALPAWCLRGDALREAIAALLEEARARLFSLVATLPDEVLRRQHSPLVSPIAWELAHVANFEERWLVSALGAERLTNDAVDEVYSAIHQPRHLRGELPSLDPRSSRLYLTQTRARALTQLVRTSFRPDDPLLRAGYVFGLAVQHEHRHIETILTSLQLLTDHDVVARERVPRPGRVLPRAEVFVPGGPFVLGTDDDGWALDNEGPAHVVQVPSFFIDAAPTSNREFLSFLEDGGYERRELWSEEGWRVLQQEGWTAPAWWRRGLGGVWVRRHFAFDEPVPLDEPVQHVSWFEAEAYARWAHKRLPTEAEWEKAASWDPQRGKRRFPWGESLPDARRANLCSPSWAPAELGAFPEGSSPCGAEQLIGDVWEWTASDFLPYPGYRPFPAAEPSAAYFSRGLKVLRGGSWATHPTLARCTVRHWQSPRDRHVFAGFRCVRDA